MSFSWMLFDADGVLQRLVTGWLDELTALGGEDFVLALFDAEHRAMAGAEDFRAVAAEVMAQFGLTGQVDDVVGVAHQIEVDLDMLAEVRSLRSVGVRCALATNQQNVRAAYMRSDLPYTDAFDAHFYSCELGVAKPDPRYFHAITEQLGADPRQVLFLDDKEENVLGAREAGLVAELFPAYGGVEALRPILARHGLGRTDAPAA